MGMQGCLSYRMRFWNSCIHYILSVGHMNNNIAHGYIYCSFSFIFVNAIVNDKYTLQNVINSSYLIFFKRDILNIVVIVEVHKVIVENYCRNNENYNSSPFFLSLGYCFNLYGSLQLCENLPIFEKVGS